MYRNILLIDDDEDDQEIFLMALEEVSKSVNCTAMTNAQQALDKLESQDLKPDVIFLDLNMPKMNVKVNAVETGITNTGDFLEADMTGAQYQWLSCPSMAPVYGETGKQFFPPAAGVYAVVVSASGCTDTSACFSYILSGISKNKVQERFTVYPNPFDQSFTIHSNDVPDPGQISIYDAYGKVVHTESLNGKNQTIDLGTYGSGLYFLVINTGNSYQVLKVNKE